MTSVFLSHTQFDSALAICLKGVLKSVFADIEVFISSDPTDLPPGVKWPQTIQDALKAAQVLVILATRRSLARPWVWFEAGTFWFSDRRIIPICFGDIPKDELPSPLRDLHAVQANDANELRDLINSISSVTGLRTTVVDLDQVSRDLVSLDVKADRLAAQNAGWIGVEWQGEFLAYEGPIQALRLIEDGVFHQAMSDALEGAGYTPRLGRSDGFSHHYEKGYRIIYLTDRKSWRQKIVQNDLVLLARPNMDGR